MHRCTRSLKCGSSAKASGRVINLMCGSYAMWVICKVASTGTVALDHARAVKNTMSTGTVALDHARAVKNSMHMRYSSVRPYPSCKKIL